MMKRIIIDSLSVWNTGTSSGSYTFANGGYFLYHSNRKLSLNTNNSNSTNWSTDAHQCIIGLAAAEVAVAAINI